jgi:hypothetical protein
VQHLKWNLVSVEKEEMESVNREPRQSLGHAEKSKTEVDQRLNDFQTEPLIYLINSAPSAQG